MSSHFGSPEPQLEPEPLPLPLSPLPPLSTQPQPTALNGVDLRQHLERLESETQTLRANQTQLEVQLESIRTRIAANDSAIQVMMSQLDQQDFNAQRAERQSAFRGTVLGSDNVLEALRRKVRGDAELKRAFLAIVTNRATYDDNNKVGAALLTELSGDVLPFLHDIAARVLECDNDIDTAMMETQPVTENETAMPPPGERPYQIHSTPSTRSPSIKSEASSAKAAANVPANMPTNKKVNATVAAARVPPKRATSAQTDVVSAVRPPPPRSRPLGVTTIEEASRRARGVTTIGEASRRRPQVVPTIESTPRPRIQGRPAEPATASAQPNTAGLSRLQKNFPGLLESLRKGQEMLNPKNPPAANTKRARESMDSDISGTPTASNTHGKQAKKQKLEKEPAYTPTFGTFIKRLETIHQQGNSITDQITCPRCQQIKQKCRILSCLHLYCHKCVLALRSEAEKGNPVTGFRAFCVKPDCDAEVSGKTSVVESEAMAFLKWYDSQPANLTSTAAQIHVLKGALDEFPDDPEILRKLKLLNAQAKQLRVSGQVDVKADLLQLVKLARKPY